MKIDKIIDILEQEYPKEAAFLEDFIGLQVKGKEEVKRIFITLNITLETLEQSIKANADLIIAHHPLFFGDYNELIKNDKILKAKVDLIRKLNINVFIIHTNADFNPISIAYGQAMALELENIEQLDQNLAVHANLKEEMEFDDFKEYLRNTFNLNNEIRTNIFTFTEKIKNLVIASGASGEIIYNEKYKNNTFIVGELKYHHWIYANENGIKIIEIGHQTEIIFNELVKIYLEEEIKDEDIKIFSGKENDAYWSV